MRDWIEDNLQYIVYLAVMFIVNASILLCSPSIPPQEECEAGTEATEVPLRWGEQPLDAPEEITPIASEQEDEEWDEQCTPEDEEETDEADTYIYIV